LFNESFSFMYTALLISLLVIIVIEIINYMTVTGEAFIRNRRSISYIVIVIFSLYVSYDTQKIIMLSNMCSDYPNYPKTSVNFFLDVINLFSRVLFLKSSK
jgi:FtsH-binding integral membrane protein